MSSTMLCLAQSDSTLNLTHALRNLALPASCFMGPETRNNGNNHSWRSIGSTANTKFRLGTSCGQHGKRQYVSGGYSNLIL